MYILAVISTIIILILSLGLSILISSNYIRKKQLNLLAWTSGLWVFSISVALEVVFSTNYETSLLMKSYLILVAVLVELLALGSVLLLKKHNITIYYGIYMIISTVFVIVSAVISHVGDIVTHGVVYGVLPILISISSITVTFPAAILLIYISLTSYIKTKNPKLLSIVVGVIIVSVAGTLYIVEFPAFLYYAEFFGILLLWIGFVDFKVLKNLFKANNNIAPKKQ
ncbi:hypothetical protein [Ferroplasma acidiphilum]|jgi:hypothetical protein|uniref:hypothetical protein n=1 Tax=Ferroplasma acidiphilum TaxID=74969 RepID=UPI002815B6E1|nr:hypothetical protein [Ferroplasma acidiphilum]WMT53877.1 MAG: hypothetical protein RE473_03270 [Ferroplasma acidiphilum]